MHWRWAAASQIGTSHLRLGTALQDAARCFVVGPNGTTICAMVCDGAGSAQYGGHGARLVCRTFEIELRRYFAATTTQPTDEELWNWVDAARDRMALAAEKRSIARQAFASTLVLLVVSGDETLVVHIGDGAVVTRDLQQSWRALSWPENGEYASTTYFVTDEPSPKLRISRSLEKFDAYAVFSDGIETIALDQRLSVPHAPFFRSMIAAVDGELSAGKSRALSNALASFLGSESVCAKTDDDKSLVLVSAR
jgi:hypothetical protein